MPITDSAVEFLRAMFVGDEQAQKEFSTDPQGTLERHGLDDCSPLEINQAVAQVAPSLPAEAQARANAYVGSTQGQGGFNSAGGTSPSHAAQGAAQVDPRQYGADDPGPAANAVGGELQAVFTEINYITQITQVDLDQVNNFTDNSVTQFIVATGDVTQTFDNDTVTATGDGAVAGAGDLSGIATGAGAVAAGENIADAQINTGVNTGIIADSANNAIVGDGNTSIDAGGGTVTNVQGDGNVTGSQLENSTVGDGNTQQIFSSSGSGNVEGVNFGEGGIVNTGNDSAIGDGNQLANDAEAVNFGDGGSASNVDADVTVGDGATGNINAGTGTQNVDETNTNINDIDTTAITSTDTTTTNTDSFNTNTDSFNTTTTDDAAAEVPEAPAPEIAE